MFPFFANNLKDVVVIYKLRFLTDFVWELCYRWTVLILVVFSFIVTCRLWFGDSFDCAPNDVFPLEYTRMQCYHDTPYISPANLTIQTGDTPVIDPVFEKFQKRQTYYPWVNLFFLAQAFCFYLPHLLWKFYEGGYIRRLTAGIHKSFDNSEKRIVETCHLAKYFILTQGKHSWYTIWYIISEIFNFTFAFTQTPELRIFFGVTGAPDFLSLKLETWSDFRKFYFPSSGYCSLTSQTHTTLTVCMMPLNKMYMYMFFFVYSWYIFLTIVTGLVLVYRIGLVVRAIRIRMILTTIKLLNLSALQFLRDTSYSDWFFMTGLQKEMLDTEFIDLLDKIVVIRDMVLQRREDADNKSTVTTIENGDNIIESEGIGDNTTIKGDNTTSVFEAENEMKDFCSSDVMVAAEHPNLTDVRQNCV